MSVDVDDGDKARFFSAAWDTLDAAFLYLIDEKSIAQRCKTTKVPRENVGSRLSLYMLRACAYLLDNGHSARMHRAEYREWAENSPATPRPGYEAP